MAQRLINEPELEIILAGRSQAKAKAACEKLLKSAPTDPARLIPLQLDRNEMRLTFKPDLIIDASGPFQAYGTQSVIDYALAEHIDYADISDDGDFVMSVLDRDGEAKTAGISLISGLSTCPVLSAIGLREIEAHIGPVTDVTIGVAPSPKAELGRNVVAAVARYAGQKRVPVLRQGQAIKVAGLTESRMETVCVPGDMPLPRLPFSVADSPDSQTLPLSFPALKNIWTGAGTQPIWLHRCLVGMSHLVRLKIFPPLTPFTGLFHRARGFFPFGAHRGGLFVRGANSTGAASWHIVAEGDDGPTIPALAVVALIRKNLRGWKPLPGAYSGDKIISLPDLQPEFDALAIQFGVQNDKLSLPVYEQIMGDAYGQLYPCIQDFHRTSETRSFQGECTIVRGRNPLSHIIATIFRFPKAGQNIPVELTITPDEAGELWERRFNGKALTSHHSTGRGRWTRHVTERFGPFDIHMAVLNEAGNMRIQTRGWSIFGIPLPKFLRPKGDIYETQRDERFIFHVDLAAPFIGRLCKYEGWLEPSKSE